MAFGATEIELYKGNLMALMRHNVAEQLHDGPIQDLLAARIRLMTLMSESEAYRKELAPLAATLESAIAALRDVVHSETHSSLPPSDPDGSRPDLYAQLITLCADFREETGITCTFEVLPEHTHFGYHVSEVLFRSVRELLANVKKHADANAVRIISGSTADGSIYLQVKDDGIGFSARELAETSEAGNGFGLWSIEHRLKYFNCHLEIENTSGGSVRIVLPGNLLEY